MAKVFIHVYIFDNIDALLLLSMSDVTLLSMCFESKHYFDVSKEREQTFLLNAKRENQQASKSISPSRSTSGKRNDYAELY